MLGLVLVAQVLLSPEVAVEQTSLGRSELAPLVGAPSTIRLRYGFLMACDQGDDSIRWTPGSKT